MSERNEPVDPRHEEALAAALHAEADSVRTAGDGLIRIRARVERRRMRMRLLVPIAGTAAVAATVTAVVGIGMLAGSNNKPSISALDTTLTCRREDDDRQADADGGVDPPATSAQPSALVTTAVVTTASAVVTSSPTVHVDRRAHHPARPGADLAVRRQGSRRRLAEDRRQQLRPVAPRRRGTAERFVGSPSWPAEAAQPGRHQRHQHR